MLSNFFLQIPWSVIYTYTPEVYPTAIRATGMGSCSAFTRIGGTITPIAGTTMLAKAFYVPFLTFGLALIVAGICAIFLPYETLGSKLKDTLSDFHQQPDTATTFVEPLLSENIEE